MSKVLNLRELERLAFRRTYQDGLWEIYTGGIVTSFAALAFTIFPGRAAESIAPLLFFLVGLSLSVVVFRLGKKYITLPRIGLVNFGPARQKRSRDLILPLAVIAAAQTLVVLLQFSGVLSPAFREWLAPVLGQVDSSRWLVAVAAVLFVAPGLLLIAYKLDIPSGYYQAVVISLAVLLMILLDQAWWMVLGGALIVFPGLFHFVRFLQRYPLEKIPDERP